MPEEYWSLFLQTGAPAAYCRYRQALDAKESHCVSANEGPGPAGNGIQGH